MDVADLAKQDVRFVSRHQPPLDATEQREPELLFRVLQDFGQGRLGDIEDAGRTADRTTDVNGVERFYLSHAHGCKHNPPIDLCDISGTRMTLTLADVQAAHARIKD